MTTINRLSATDTLTAGDLIPVYKQSQGDARKAALSTLLAYIQENITVTGGQVAQYAAPTDTGFSITVNSGDVWLVITGTYTPIDGTAAGTIALPDNAADGDTVTVNTTELISPLTVSSGRDVVGEPDALAANGFFTMRYDAVNTSWYRIG